MLRSKRSVRARVFIKVLKDFTRILIHVAAKVGYYCPRG